MAKDLNPNARNIFRMEEYLNSFKDIRSGFITALSETQHFYYFIEKSYLALTKPNELTYFLKGTKILKENGKGPLTVHLEKIYNKLMYNYQHVKPYIF